MGKITTKVKTRDVAFQFRMGAGFPGDVNRTHPASIEPTLIDSSAPPTAYGQPVVVDATTQGVRALAATDTALTDVYGFTVRPFPLQASSASNYGAASLGAATPPTTGVIDVMRSGYIMGQMNTSGGSPVKGGRVYVWVAATTTGHIQGNLETSASAGNTIELPLTTLFNGPADSNGYVELSRTA